MNQGIVLGIDGGGTYTRVAVADLKGNILGFSKKDGSHPGKNQNPEVNVKAAINEALQFANQSRKSVRYIVGGFAGLNDIKDKKWAEQYLSINGIEATTILVNDAEVAQYGAFLGGTGVLAIAGTGSIVLGKTDKDLIIKNYDFHHDSEAAARFLSYAVIYEIISKITLPEDQRFINDILEYWEAKNIEDLRIIASEGFSKNKIEAIQKLSKMASIVTNGATNGNKIANRACEKVVGSLATGVQLVSSMFSSDMVSVSFVGGLANSPYINVMLREQLKFKGETKEFIYKSPQLSPVLGAVLYAYKEIGIEVNKVVNKLLYSNQTNDYS